MCVPPPHPVGKKVVNSVKILKIKKRLSLGCIEFVILFPALCYKISNLFIVEIYALF